MIIVYAVVKSVDVSTRKTNPLIAAEIPVWSTQPMVYNYIEDFQ